MRSIRKRHYTGKLPLGCRLCEKGAKLVLFVTGVCAERCFFCPLSEKRKGKDVSWANERLINRLDDLVFEAKRMKALGAGITGGDPLIRMDRALEYISSLKSFFGRDFHVHLYTGRALSKADASKLSRGGLDEIRFHLIDYVSRENKSLWESISYSIDVGIETGIEIPAIPGSEEKIVAIGRRLEDMGGGFLNLNELEFSDTNFIAMEDQGYFPKSELSYAVMGSEETALLAMELLDGFNVHYCSSSFKDSVQLRNRLLRTAENTARDFETVSEDGLFIKGVIEIPKSDLKDLNVLRKNLIQRYGIPGDLLSLDLEKKRIETSVEVAEFLAKNHRTKGVRYSVIEEYPTADRLETSKTWLK